MKRLFIFFVVFILMFSLKYCLATAETSGEQVEYLEDYEEYVDLISGVNDEYKNAYEEFVNMRKENYELYERPIMYRAKVLEASQVQTYYGQYQSIYKVTYQNLNIEILDGEYKGKTIENFNYVLTVDTYENLILSEAKVGDVVNVCAFENDDGTLDAFSLGLDSTIERWPGVLVLIIIAIALLFIYLGAKGAKMLIPIILFIDLAFVVFVPLIFEGVNILVLCGILLIASAIVISLLKLGGRPSAWLAVLTSMVLTFIMALAIFGADQLVNMSGITFETTSMSGVFYDLLSLYDTPYSAVTLAELLPQGNIDLYSLKLAFEIIIIFFATITIICNAIKTYENTKGKTNRFRETLLTMKEYAADELITILPILLVVMLPKYMLLFINKCTLIEILNSEILLADVIRMIFVSVSIALAAPLAAFFGMIALDEEK